jgi:hypothetical protein
MNTEYTTRLQFIGRDGSMCLKHGRHYDCRIISDPHQSYIWVYWVNNHAKHVSGCPYSSLKNMLENWRDAEEE